MNYQIFPDLTSEEYQELKDDISARGVQVPVELDENGNILDGHHRVKICQELGITDYCTVTRYGLSEKEKLLHVRKLNIARRHLNQEQKRGLIAEQLKETPEMSDRQIARGLNVSPTTTGNIRKELEEKGDVSRLDTSTDTLGRKQPRHRSVFSTKENQEKLDCIAQEKPELLQAVDNGNRSINSAYNQIQKEKHTEERKNNVAIPLPKDKYRTIVIDPPWPMNFINREVRPSQSTLPYSTMTLEEIRRFPVADLFYEDGSHVYLWTTHKFLPVAFDLFKEWGIKYQCLMTWVKNVGPTPFSWMYSTEHVLFGRFGNLQLLKLGERLDFSAKVQGHSRKPDEFYEIVKRVSPEPRIDVFSRKKRDGFSQYGNEADLRDRQAA